MTPESAITATEAGLVACRACGRLEHQGVRRCARCGSRLSVPDRRSLQAVWALLITGILAYIPANIWPMLVSSTLGRERADTIVAGAVELAERGSYFVALIVITASVLIPVAKFIAIAWIAWTIGHPPDRRPSEHARHRLHTIVEFIGRWSMIDVFVVAVLAALVQLGVIATIQPGPAAGPFAASVILTMLAAQALDPRLIWLEERR